MGEKGKGKDDGGTIAARSLPSMTSKLGRNHSEEKRHKYSAIMQYQHIIMQQDNEHQEQGVSRERRQRHRQI